MEDEEEVGCGEAAVTLRDREEAGIGDDEVAIADEEGIGVDESPSGFFFFFFGAADGATPVAAMNSFGNSQFSFTFLYAS